MAVILGENLIDGGFEAQAGWQNGSSIIPIMSNWNGRFGDLQLVDGTVINGSYWAQFDYRSPDPLLSVGANSWWISTANPRTGQYHARTTVRMVGSVGEVYALGLKKCGVDRYDTLRPLFNTCEVEPGLLVSISLYAMITGTGTSRVDMTISFLDRSGYFNFSNLSNPTPEPTLGNAYQRFVWNTTVPNAAKYAFFHFSMGLSGLGGSDTRVVDVDDVSLVLSEP